MGSLEEEADIMALKHKFEELEAVDQEPANRLFYLSISPRLFEATFTNMKATRIAYDAGGWGRVVIEKPFGRDLA